MICDAILLVEDNADDAELMRVALQYAKIENHVSWVNDGQSAIDYLSGVGEYIDRQKFPLPFLVLLDLKMPRVHGTEVLQWIREQFGFSIIVVILTSSAQSRDVIETAHRQANSYLVKPAALQDLYALAELIRVYWIEQNQWARLSS